MQKNKPLESQFLRYALPSMFSQLLNSFFIIVDGFFVGQNLGDVGLAAINVAWPLVAVIQAVSMMIGIGGAVRLALDVGRNDIESALRARGNALIMLAIASLVLGLGFYATYPVLLPLLGANAELYPLAAEYIRVVCILCSCQIFTTGCLPLLRGSGHTITAMTLMILGLLGNIWLDWLFIQHYHGGMTGAALATMLSQGVCAVFILPLLLMHKGWPVTLSQFILQPRRMMGILHYGMSAFGLSISTSILLLLNNLQSLRYGGTEGVAIYAVLSYTLGSVIPLVSGIGDGIQPLLSNAEGAGSWKTVCVLRRKGFLLSICTALGCSALCWAFRHELPVIFGTGPSAAAVASKAMWTLAVAFPLMAVVRFLCSYFCAVGKPVASSILAYGEPLVAQPLFLFLLPLVWKLDGVWMAYPAAIFCTALVALWLLKEHCKRQKNS